MKSLGNHEFDEGIDSLSNFLSEVNFPVLAANINIEKEHEFSSKNLKKSHIFNVGGREIGVIGYLTDQTKHLSLVNNIEFEDEITAIK